MGATIFVALFSLTAHAEMYWSPAPAKHGHGGHDRHATKGFVLNEGEGAKFELLNPQLSSVAVELEHGHVMVKSTGMDNYHALVATRGDGKLQESAIRYVYMFGKPSGESPSRIMGFEKAALEIEPAPYTREHWRYLSATQARFLLRYRGAALPNVSVMLKTSNGSNSGLKTDADGMLTVELPEDFSNIKPGQMANRPGEFILTARHSDSGNDYITTFSSNYHVNPEHWQSTDMGAAVVVAGMLIGGVVLVSRRRKEK